MAAGKVCTGFSLPWVALYAENAGTVTYSQAMALARGVAVSLSIDEADDSKFFANNQLAESASGVFGGGEATLTVDGLKEAAAKLIYGLPAADNEGWTHFGKQTQVPYVGIGFVMRYMEDGNTTYTAVVLRKAKFKMFGNDAATQEESVDWQTQELTATLFRDDTSDEDWRYMQGELATEAAAEALIKTMFGVTP